MLESIRDIFNTANIQFESINFSAQEINGPNVMIDFIENDKKTPVVSACNPQFCQTTGQWLLNAHAMVATGIKIEVIGGQTKQFLQCKNSYRDDPNVSGIF